MTTSSKYLKRAGPVAVAIAALALFAVPAASSQGGPQYPDATADSGSAPDISGVTVSSDKTSGQVVFRIVGTNLSTSPNFITFLKIDSDANPITGDLLAGGADYFFAVDDTTYGFAHWTGSDLGDTPYSTVTVSGGGGGTVLISVNKSELGNTSDFNFSVDTLDVANNQWDHAPGDGMFNYSLDASGPAIASADVQTKPGSGPRGGRAFTLTPLGLKLPPNGSASAAEPKPDSYSCRATLKGRALLGTGAGGCTFRIPKKARGRILKVVLSVTYEGATKTFPFSFKVG